MGNQKASKPEEREEHIHENIPRTPLSIFAKEYRVYREKKTKSKKNLRHDELSTTNRREDDSPDKNHESSLTLRGALVRISFCVIDG